MSANPAHAPDPREEEDTQVATRISPLRIAAWTVSLSLHFFLALFLFQIPKPSRATFNLIEGNPSEAGQFPASSRTEESDALLVRFIENHTTVTTTKAALMPQKIAELQSHSAPTKNDKITRAAHKETPIESNKITPAVGSPQITAAEIMAQIAAGTGLPNDRFVQRSNTLNSHRPPVPGEEGRRDITLNWREPVTPKKIVGTTTYLLRQLFDCSQPKYSDPLHPLTGPDGSVVMMQQHFNIGPPRTECDIPDQ